MADPIPEDVLAEFNQTIADLEEAIANAGVETATEIAVIQELVDLSNALTSGIIGENLTVIEDILVSATDAVASLAEEGQNVITGTAAAAFNEVANISAGANQAIADTATVAQEIVTDLSQASADELTAITQESINVIGELGFDARSLLDTVSTQLSAVTLNNMAAVELAIRDQRQTVEEMSTQFAVNQLSLMTAIEQAITEVTSQQAQELRGITGAISRSIQSIFDEITGDVDSLTAVFKSESDESQALQSTQIDILKQIADQLKDRDSTIGDLLLSAAKAFSQWL